MTDNYLQFFIDIFYRLIDFAQYAFQFIFRDIDVGGVKINMFGMLLGGGFLAFWVIRLIKAFNPLS